MGNTRINSLLHPLRVDGDDDDDFYSYSLDNCNIDKVMIEYLLASLRINKVFIFF